MALTPLITIIFLDTLSILISSPSMPCVRACIPLFFLPRLFSTFFFLPPSFHLPCFPLFRIFRVVAPPRSSDIFRHPTTTTTTMSPPLTSYPLNAFRFSRSVQRSSGAGTPSLSLFYLWFGTRCKTENEIMIVDRWAILRFLPIIFFDPAT